MRCIVDRLFCFVLFCFAFRVGYCGPSGAWTFGGSGWAGVKKGDTIGGRRGKSWRGMKARFALCHACGHRAGERGVQSGAGLRYGNAWDL
jgi:hypothetical protein